MEVVNAVGRRKTAVARVYLNEGKGNITINKKSLEEYFTLSDGELISQARWISSHTEGENWYLNDQETTQEAYENWKTENVTGENFVVEYQNAHTITEENIQTYVK